MMTMKLAKRLIPVLLLLNTACANTPYPSEKAINEACTLELQAARTAIKLRDKNKTKSSLSAQLAPLQKDSSRLLVNLYQIVDEAYEYTWLNDVTYSIYRFQLCQRQLQHKPYPLTIKPVLPILRQCQDQDKTARSMDSTNCILNGFDHLTAMATTANTSRPPPPDSTHHNGVNDAPID